MYKTAHDYIITLDPKVLEESFQLLLNDFIENQLRTKYSDEDQTVFKAFAEE